MGTMTACCSAPSTDGIVSVRADLACVCVVTACSEETKKTAQTVARVTKKNERNACEVVFMGRILTRIVGEFKGLRPGIARTLRSCPDALKGRPYVSSVCI